MKAPTIRQKAEAHVALIRHEYPNPRAVGQGLHGVQKARWYCVGVAACRFGREHGGPRNPDVSIGGPDRHIATLNDEGHIEEAWGALTDYYEGKFSQ